LWRIFRKHHYLNHSNIRGSICFVGYINDDPVAFLSVIHFPHPSHRNLKKVHRLVVLPDYQGIGFGGILLDFVGKYFTLKGFKFGITTSQPSLNFSLKKKKNWNLIRNGRMPNSNQNKGLSKTVSSNRITASWFYQNK
jgi:GNAT superfamily N-acetyltransferase